MVKLTYMIYRVFPGGQLDPNESFETTLRREILEEVGIDINKLENPQLKPILIYESAYPNETPIFQCLVVFFLIKFNNLHESINMKIDTLEVQAYSWINSELLKEILFDSDKCFNSEFYANMFVNNEFKSIRLDKSNLLNKDYGEYFPYGHYLACKYL